MAKICWIDLETSGLDTSLAGIIEIGAVMEIDGREVGTFHTYINPASTLIVDPEALEVNGMTLEQIRSAPCESAAKDAFTKWLGQFIDKFDKTDKALIGGFNVGFDVEFIRAFWNRAGDKYLGSWFYWHLVDMRAFAAYYLRDDWADMPNGKLQTVVKRIIGDDAYNNLMEGQQAHTALTDIRGTIEAFHKMMGTK